MKSTVSTMLSRFLLIVATLFLLSACEDHESDTTAWMMTYWEENVSPAVFPKEDALRLARACQQYDSNPKQRFVEMIAWAQEFGLSVQMTFHSYDPDTQTFTNPKHAAELAILMTQRGDIRNGNFIEAIARRNSQTTSDKQGRPEAPASPPHPEINAGDVITLLKPVASQYVPTFNPRHSPLTSHHYPSHR